MKKKYNNNNNLIITIINKINISNCSIAHIFYLNTPIFTCYYWYINKTKMDINYSNDYCYN